jgi:hypothetical protein
MSGMFGANTAPPNISGNVSNFQFPGMGGAASDALSQSGQFSTGTFGQGANQFLPQMQGITENLINQSGPLSQFGMQTAGNVSGPGVALGMGSQGLAGQVQGGASSLVPYAQNILQQGMDPQNAVYNRALQQTTDTTGANLANSGVGATPYGQSVLGNTVGQFNTDWQQNLLNRQTQAAGAAGNLVNQAGGAGQTADALGQSGASSAIQSAMLPYSVNSQVGGQNLNWLNQLGSGTNTYAQIPQMGINDLMAYLSGGNQANSIMNQGTGIYNQGQEALANFNAQQQQQLFNNMGSFGSGVAGLFGGSGLFGKSGAFGSQGAFGSGGAFPGMFG